MKTNVIYWGLFTVTLFPLVLFSQQIEPFHPEGLRKLTNEERIDQARSKQTIDPTLVIYKNDQGKIIPHDSLEKFRNGFFGNQYVNEEGQTIEMVLRKITEEDKKLLVELRDAWYEDEEKSISEVQIECHKGDSILQAVYDIDQRMRASGNSIDQEVDFRNLEIVVNLIEQCGIPTLNHVSQKGMDAIWLVFQHTIYINYRKEYLPLLKESAKNGDLNPGKIALMEDRILMSDYKPQIYGTQVTRNDENSDWELYDLADPEYVDKRRAEVGLGPLKDYLRRWDIEFEVEQKR